MQLDWISRNNQHYCTNERTTINHQKYIDAHDIRHRQNKFCECFVFISFGRRRTVVILIWLLFCSYFSFGLCRYGKMLSAVKR